VIKRAAYVENEAKRRAAHERLRSTYCTVAVGCPYRQRKWVHSMDCVSPPCTGAVCDDKCPVCGLRQRRTPQGVKVDGPLYVTRRTSEDVEQPLIGRSLTVGERVVTVHLRINDKATRTFKLNALVSIDFAGVV
jgi:hypothetical protein